MAREARDADVRLLEIIERYGLSAALVEDLLRAIIEVPERDLQRSHSLLAGDLCARMEVVIALVKDFVNYVDDFEFEAHRQLIATNRLPSEKEILGRVRTIAGNLLKQRPCPTDAEVVFVPRRLLDFVEFALVRRRPSVVHAMKELRDASIVALIEDHRAVLENSRDRTAGYRITATHDEGDTTPEGVPYTNLLDQPFALTARDAVDQFEWIVNAHLHGWDGKRSLAAAAKNWELRGSHRFEIERLNILGERLGGGTWIAFEFGNGRAGFPIDRNTLMISVGPLIDLMDNADNAAITFRRGIARIRQIIEAREQGLPIPPASEGVATGEGPSPTQSVRRYEKHYNGVEWVLEEFGNGSFKLTNKVTGETTHHQSLTAAARSLTTYEVSGPRFWGDPVHVG